MNNRMAGWVLAAVLAVGVTFPAAGQDDVKELQERVSRLESAVSKLEQCMGALHDALGSQGYGRHPQASDEAKTRRDQEVAKLKAMAGPELEKLLIQLYQREDEARVKSEAAERRRRELAQNERLGNPGPRFGEPLESKPEERLEAFRSRTRADNAQRSARQAYEEARQALQLALSVYAQRLAELPGTEGQQPAGADPAKGGPVQP